MDSFNTIGNLRLQEMINEMAIQRGAKLFASDERFCIDNGVMIAHTGLTEYKALGKAPLIKDTACSQRFRTDQVFVSWRD